MIRFVAQVARIQTMADGGLRFTLDVGEDCTMQAAQLMEVKRVGALLEVEATPKILKNPEELAKKSYV